MISVAGAQAQIFERARPLPPEEVSLDLAHGRVLREAVQAGEDFPPFDRSAMDGYAVRLGDGVTEWEIVGEIRAGQNIDLNLKDGEAVRIFTGARLPGPGLKVVMQEDAEALKDRVRLLRPSSELNIRCQGEDVRAGEILLDSGTLLNAAAVALLASAGKTSGLVSRSPRILHLTTGDEIVPPEQALRPGEIRNSNSFLIATLCREWGGRATHRHAPDDPEAMKEILRRARPEDHDLVLISGGSGEGKYDFTAELFGFFEAEIQFRQVDVRPGKPLIFGSSPSHLVFGLPGNALSHFVCFHLFVRPALAKLQALPETAMGAAIVAESVPKTANRRETWWPARLSFREERIELKAISWKSSGDITRLPSADALMLVPAGTPELPAGARVRYLPLRPNL